MRQVYIFSVQGSRSSILHSHSTIMKHMNNCQKELEGNGLTTRVSPTDEAHLKMELGKKLLWMARATDENPISPKPESSTRKFLKDLWGDSL